MTCSGIGFPRPSFSNSTRECKDIRQIDGDSTGTTLPDGDKNLRLCLVDKARQVVQNQLVSVNRGLNGGDGCRRCGWRGGLAQVLWHLDDGYISRQPGRIDPIGDGEICDSHGEYRQYNQSPGQ